MHKVNDSRILVAFLYALLRDHLPAGIVEEAVRDAEQFPLAEYTNGYLAEYAQELAERLYESADISTE